MITREILVYLIDSRKVNIADLSRVTGISRNAIYAITSGKTSSIKRKTLVAISDYFNTTIEQLTGEAPLPGYTEGFAMHPAGPCHGELDPKLWAKIPGDISHADKVIIRTFFDTRGGFNLRGIADIDNLAVRLVWQYLYYCMLEIAEGEG